MREIGRHHRPSEMGTGMCWGATLIAPPAMPSWVFLDGSSYLWQAPKNWCAGARSVWLAPPSKGVRQAPSPSKRVREMSGRDTKYWPRGRQKGHSVREIFAPYYHDCTNYQSTNGWYWRWCATRQAHPRLISHPPPARCATSVLSPSRAGGVGRGVGSSRRIKRTPKFSFQGSHLECGHP